MSKIGKLFKSILGIKKKKVFIQVPGKVPKQGSEAEVAQRRQETAARLRSGRVTALAKEEEEEETIRRAGARRAKLLGS